MTRKTDNEGKIHSDEGPAVTHDDGSCVYYNHGVIHRADGPAVRLVFADGSIEEQYWFKGREIK